MSQENQETVETTEVTDTPEFDAAKFTSEDAEEKSDNQDQESLGNESETTSETTEETTSNSSDDNFSWDDEEGSFEEQSSESAEQENLQNAEELVAEENNSTDNSLSTGISNEFFSSLKEKIGVEVKNEEELGQVLEQLAIQNMELKKASEAAGVTNDRIKKIETILKMEDEEILRKDFELNGFNEDQINKAIETLQDNGTLDIEALKIRKNLENYVVNERTREVEARREADAMRQQQTAKEQEELKNYLSKTDSMFGLKMAKTDAGVEKAREKHFSYITSGDFFGEITKDNESLAQVAWLWKYKDKILKAMTNRGDSTGKRQVLDNMENPSKKITKTLPDADNSGGFDPNLFLAE